MPDRPTPERPPDGLVYRTSIGSDPAEIEAVRNAVRGVAREAGFADRASDIVLALDELLANAQEHGCPPVRVAAWSDGRLVVEVEDSGGGLDARKVWKTHPPTPHGTRGRGLWIVRQLTDLVRIDSDDDGTRVRFELSPDPPIGA